MLCEASSVYWGVQREGKVCCRAYIWLLVLQYVSLGTLLDSIIHVPAPQLLHLGPSEGRCQGCCSTCRGRGSSTRGGSTATALRPAQRWQQHILGERAWCRATAWRAADGGAVCCTAAGLSATGAAAARVATAPTDVAAAAAAAANAFNTATASTASANGAAAPATPTVSAAPAAAAAASLGAGDSPARSLPAPQREQAHDRRDVAG